MPMGAIFLSGLLAIGQAQAEAARLLVRLNGISDAGGQLRISLYRDAESFRKEERAVRIATLPAQAGSTEVSFSGLEPGRYAVMAYHDANSDNRLNLRFGMFPAEGHGLSNNPTVIGPPKFSDSAFEISSPAGSVVINLSY